MSKPRRRHKGLRKGRGQRGKMGRRRVGQQASEAVEDGHEKGEGHEAFRAEMGPSPEMENRRQTPVCLSKESTSK